MEDNFTQRVLNDLEGGFSVAIVDNLFLYTYNNGYQIIMDLDKMSVIKRVDSDGKRSIVISQGGESITLNPSQDTVDGFFECIFQAKRNFFLNQKKLQLRGYKNSRKKCRFI